LLLYATLDTADPCLSLSDCGVACLHLLDCLRCSLSWYDFSYRIISDREVELVEVHRGERIWDEWRDSVGVDEFQRRPFSLTPIPQRLQILWDVLNAGHKLSSSEESEVASLIGRFADPAVGAYPIVDTINQVGGRAFLQQRLDDPECPYCVKYADATRMRFLACLQNDEGQQLRVAYEDVQVVFFFCTKCATVKVIHSL
jgi:hypothetical protein